MTIREIAAIAGVSPAAVSLVINNKKGVSAETRRHIQSIMEECGYVPAPVRRKADRFRLMILKFRAHGIALEENQGFTASIIDRIESECRRFAFDLVMCNCEPAFATPLGAVPVNRELTAQLVRYLYSLGHREIQYYKFTQPVNNCDERYEGYLQELHRLGLEPSEPIMLKPTVDGAFEDMKRLIKSGEYVPHGAAIADNDTVAIGAIKAIREAGYSIPEDISIVGFDDIPFSAVTMPALTTMRISRSQMGTLAVDLIRKRIKNLDWPGMHMHIGGKLIVRNSTRAVDD